MASIIPFLPDGMQLRDSVFEAHEIKAMSAAFAKVCETMNLQDDSSAKQIMAARIIDLVRREECSPTRLRDRVLREASLAEAAYAAENAAPSASATGAARGELG